MVNATGYDVSHWQSSTPTGRDFLIAKASQGTYKDSMYTTHRKRARDAGIMFGAYCFNQPGMSIETQVNFFISAAGNADFYALDVEKEVNAGRQFTLAETKQFISLFKSKTGKKIGLYMSESGYYFFAGQNWRWIAHWGVDVPDHSNWQIHQYRGSPLDLDQFNGTADEMRAYFGLTPDTGEDMGFQQVNVPKGTWLYVNSDLSSDSNNVQVDPGRPMLLVKAGAATGAHLLMHDTNFKHYYVKKSTVTLTPLITEDDCPDCPPCPECPPPTADDCKSFSDAAYQEGYDKGYDVGSDAGYEAGRNDGYEDGHEAGLTEGEEIGVQKGISQGIEQEQTRIKDVLGLE